MWGTGERGAVFVFFFNCREMQWGTADCTGISSKKHNVKGAQGHVGRSVACRLWASSLSKQGTSVGGSRTLELKNVNLSFLKRF